MAARLKRVLPEIVFVGGCTTGLLITDPAASPVRVTDDVDVIVEVASYAEYARFSKRLRNLGFSEDSSAGAPICRWLIDHMKLDVMPTDETILGFSNRWYKPAIESAAIVGARRVRIEGRDHSVLHRDKIGGIPRKRERRLLRQQ
jgi:hypothetical protein